MRYLLHLLIIAIPLIMGADVVGQYASPPPPPSYPLPQAQGSYAPGIPAAQPAVGIGGRWKSGLGTGISPGTQVSSSVAKASGPYWKKIWSTNPTSMDYAFCYKACNKTGCQNPFLFKECISNCQLDNTFGFSIDNCVRTNLDSMYRYAFIPVEGYSPQTPVCSIPTNALVNNNWETCKVPIIQYLEAVEAKYGNDEEVRQRIVQFNREEDNFKKGLSILYDRINEAKTMVEKLNKTAMTLQDDIHKVLQVNNALASKTTARVLVPRFVPSQLPLPSTDTFTLMNQLAQIIVQYNTNVAGLVQRQAQVTSPPPVIY